MLSSYGAAIVNRGYLILESSSFKNSYSRDGGGAIYNGKNLTIHRTIFEDNISHGGGAIQTDEGGLLTITCSRFARNIAQYGGGILVGSRSSNVNVSYSSFAANDATPGGDDIHSYTNNGTIRVFYNWWNNDGASIGTPSGPPNVVPLIKYDPTIIPYGPNCQPHTSIQLPPTPFTSLDFYGEDIEFQGVIFWLTFWETSSDTYVSGSAADNDLPNHSFVDFLFQPNYCISGINAPSDNGIEQYIFDNPMNPSDPYWVYIKHCPYDHRFMFARTMLNGFLNYERRNQSPFQYVPGNYSSFYASDANSLWKYTLCESQGSAGNNFSDAKGKNTLPEWLYNYMICIGTNPNLSQDDVFIQRVRRAYNITLLPQIRLAIANFYDVSAPISDPTTGEPTYGAFSNMDANITISSADGKNLGDSYLACVGGCYLSQADQINGNLIYTYRGSQKKIDFRFAKLVDTITIEDVQYAYNQHIRGQIFGYAPAYSAVLQPVLRWESGGYTWVTRVYRRSPYIEHFPRLPIQP